MASVQAIERALRERFGPEETILTLAEILSFLQTHQNSHCAAGNPKEQRTQHSTQQNAPSATISRDQSQQNASQRPAAKTKGPQNTRSLAKPSGSVKQLSQDPRDPTRPSEIAIPLSQGAQSPKNKEKTPRMQP